jgi:hypothetical protein
MSILMPALARVRELAQRVVCGTNASGIVKSMMVYANDEDTSRFPRAGWPGGIWGGTAAWDGIDRLAAFGAAPGEAAVTASLYLLVKYDYTTPKQFLCKSDAGVAGATLADPALAWDFPNGGGNCSYSYHMPYSFDRGDGTMVSYTLTAASEPGLAAVADRNPHLDPAADTTSERFNPTGSKEQQQIWNSEAHQKDGQSVAYIDTHVKFEDVSFCGLSEDNIYVRATDKDRRKGTPPALGEGPVDRLDSLLVSE